MLRDLPNSSFAIALLVAAWSPALLLAQEIADFTGTYGIVAESGDDVNEAIDAATADRNFLMRGLMRDRLKDALAPATRIVISTTPEGSIEVAGSAGNALQTPVDGSPVVWTHPNGETLQVRTRFEDGEIRQRFDGKGAVREHVYRLRASGSILELHVTVTSDRLSQPIDYTLTYARDSHGAERAAPSSSTGRASRVMPAPGA